MCLTHDKQNVREERNPNRMLIQLEHSSLIAIIKVYSIRKILSEEKTNPPSQRRANIEKNQTSIKNNNIETFEIVNY